MYKQRRILLISFQNCVAHIVVYFVSPRLHFCYVFVEYFNRGMLGECLKGLLVDFNM